MTMIPDQDAQGTPADPGPAPGLTLAACHASGCSHRECLRAARAHERLTEPRDAAGTRRRLQALAVMGHATAALAARLGVPDRVVRRVQRGNPASVPAALAEAVAVLYDQLWDVRGTSHHAVVKMAGRRGWVPPLGWDDDDEDGHGIDDPAAVPADWKPRRRTSPLAARAEDLAEVMTEGYTPQQAAWRLGIPRGTVDTLRSRAARTAVAS